MLHQVVAPCSGMCDADRWNKSKKVGSMGGRWVEERRGHIWLLVRYCALGLVLPRY